MSSSSCFVDLKLTSQHTEGDLDPSYHSNNQTATASKNTETTEEKKFRQTEEEKTKRSAKQVCKNDNSFAPAAASA